MRQGKPLRVGQLSPCGMPVPSVRSLMMLLVLALLGTLTALGMLMTLGLERHHRMVCTVPVAAVSATQASAMRIRGSHMVARAGHADTRETPTTPRLGRNRGGSAGLMIRRVSMHAGRRR
jgi:hypothetical protein